jgi:hypothetical protein
MDSLSPRVALSETGQYVVFATTSTATNPNSSKAWVALADGTGTAIELSNSANFVRTPSTSDVDQYGSFFWADDSNLLFWAGTSSTKLDLFHYNVGTGALNNLTLTGTKSAAPWDGGNWEVDGGWVAPNGGFIYYIAGTTTAMGIKSVDLSTFAFTDITIGLDIDSESALGENMEGLQGSQWIWFIAEKVGATVTVEDLYVFNQNTGTSTSLANLTNHTSASSLTMENLAISPDATLASYTIGSAGSTILYAVPTAGSAAPFALNGAGSYVAGAYEWSPDSTFIVYGGGTAAAGDLDLMKTEMTNPTPTTLYSAGSYIYVFLITQ